MDPAHLIQAMASGISTGLAQGSEALGHHWSDAHGKLATPGRCRGKLGTHKTVKPQFLSWLSGKSP